MNRILTITYDDLSLDPDGCSGAVNSACSHQETMKVVGVAVDEDCLVISLEDSDPHDLIYNFAPVEADNVDSLRSELSARYYASFSLVCGFMLRDARWALYVSEKKPRKQEF